MRRVRPRRDSEHKIQLSLWISHQHFIYIHVKKKSKSGKSKQRSREQLHRPDEVLEDIHDCLEVWQTLAISFRAEF